jgi:hypothetical protein
MPLLPLLLCCCCCHAAGNAFMAELQSRIVPLLVEQEDFWARYFYRWVK